MSYYTQALLAQDQDIILRCTAAAAREGIPDPAYWAQTRLWQLSAQPGWDDAYASALASKVENPGRDEGVITDHMILSAVQALKLPETEETTD